MKNLLRRSGALFLELLFPAACLNCRRAGAWLCADCFSKLRQVEAGNDGQAIDGHAKNRRLIAPALNRIFIAGDYEDRLLASLIKRFKYNFLSSLGEPLGRFLAAFWEEQLSRAENAGWRPDGNRSDSGWRDKAAPLLIPIPLSRRREKWRGFNQAEVLTRELNRRFGYEAAEGLHRVRHHEAQASLSEAERLDNIRGVFAWSGGRLEGRSVILVDDVVTTGATLNEAALVLRAAGAARICGLVLAKG